MKEIQITTEFIRLDAFLKLTAVVGSGGEAKTIVQDGAVAVNNEICTMRTRKLRDGDTVSVGGETFAVRGGTK